MVKSQSDKIGLLIELKAVAAKTLTVCVLHSRELAKENPKGSVEKKLQFHYKSPGKDMLKKGILYST